MSVRLTSAVLALIIAAGGCSAATAESPSRPGETTASAVHVPFPGEEAQQLAVPFDAYNFSPAEIMTIEAAEDLLIRDCMRGQGMEWKVVPLPAEEDIEPQNRRRYGVIEPQIGRLFGYHTPLDRPSVAQYNAARNDRMAQLSPAARRAAHGDPAEDADGCSQKAREHLSKGTPNIDTSLFNTLISQTFDESQRDGDVVAAFRAWSACMKEKGFHYPDPLAAVTDERWMSAGSPSRQETTAAETDVWCKEKTDLVSIWAAAEKRIQQDAVRTHAAYFRALKISKGQQLKAAALNLRMKPASVEGPR
ncbi:hypothetical protein [Nonomuraea turcica]|uniref:hypothetical protein n=1 Tax=Nonomuraea sp. G32 TaxID=3067274 RepID=UPI00273C92C6|nr:hypothetical protein [Nonomuraea sp. G32]MDP4511558.1 hypothetical protein [Nonomuraea sp. G32]